jgi:glutamate racemase
MNKLPIGIFDSGIGGLTVAKEIIRILPNESIIYLGDTARVPYGTRGKEVITKFSQELVNFLVQQRVKTLVIACNTISATCLSELRNISPVPIIDVITPTVEYAVLSSITKIGVIGTPATINSGVYEKLFAKFDKKIKVKTQACPMFVPLAEEGLINDKATELIAKNYLLGFKNIPSLILACTHYPILHKVIQKTVGPKTQIIDPAKPTAKALKDLLSQSNLLNDGKSITYKFYVTDETKRTAEIANLFFDNKFPGKLEKVVLD